MTYLSNIAPDLLQKLQNIRLIAFDVDGIFSDGRIYMGNAGEELKAFHTLDGYGIKAIMKQGIEVAVITGRQSNIVEQRMQALGVKHILQGREDKSNALSGLQATLGISVAQTASMGDDMPDLGMFTLSAISISVPNGHPVVKNHADYVTSAQGGFGAVREACDLLLMVHNVLQQTHSASV